MSKRFQDLVLAVEGLPDDVRSEVGERLRLMDVSWAAVDRMTFGIMIAIYALADNKERTFESLKSLMDVYEAMLKNVTDMFKTGPLMDEMACMQVSRKCAASVQALDGLNGLGLTIALNFMALLPSLWASYVAKAVNAWAACQQQLDEDDAVYLVDMMRQLHETKVKVLHIKVEKAVFRVNSSSFRIAEKWAKDAGETFNRLMAEDVGVEHAFKQTISSHRPPWVY